MPGSALEDLHDGICQVEEKIKPDEEMNEYECRFLEGRPEDTDIEQENGQFGNEDQRAVCDLRNIRYLYRQSQQNPKYYLSLKPSPSRTGENQRHPPVKN